MARNLVLTPGTGEWRFEPEWAAIPVAPEFLADLSPALREALLQWTTAVIAPEAALNTGLDLGRRLLDELPLGTTVEFLGPPREGDEADAPGRFVEWIADTLATLERLGAWTAYSSTLSVHFGDSPDSRDAQPDLFSPFQDGVVTDADNEELAELRRLVVDSVVKSLLTAQELSKVVVYRERGTGMVRAYVCAVGESMDFWLQDPSWAAEISVEQFAANVEDWVCESHFGWGQQRVYRP